MQAQTASAPNTALTKIIPPSPNASSLGIYGAIPVSKYTGVPSIEIPIYTLSAGSLSLPISLNYHASGIKVSQEASWVGLGWSLNAGGVISRSIRGNDDFNPFNGYLHNSSFPCTGGTCPVSPANWQAWDAVLRGQKDSAPDEFYYNVGGYAGKMVYVRSTGKFMPLKADNLRITYNGQWAITAPNGVRYVFATTEKTSNYSVSSGQEIPENIRHNIIGYNATPPAVTSWYLDSVVSPTKEYIAFKYRRSSYQIPSIVYENQSFHWLYAVTTPLCPAKAIGNGTAYGTMYQYDEVVTDKITGYSYSQTAVEETCLQEMQSSNGTKLTFVTDGRQDLNTLPDATTLPQKLTKITISSLGTTRTIEHEFSYSYFPTSIPSGTPASQSYRYLRLRLDQVIIRAGDLIKSPYRFVYNNSVLPAKDSKSIDHWGFYNGATGNDSGPSDWDPYARNGSLIPSYNLNLPSSNAGGEDKWMKGAIRDPNEATVQNGLLTSITYPTGGKTTFSYGINRYHERFNTTRVTRDLVRIQSRTLRNTVAQRVYKTFTVTAPGNVTVRSYSYPIPFGSPDYQTPSIQETCSNATKIYRDPNTGDIPSLVYCCITKDDLAYNQGSYLGWVKYNDPGTPIPCGAPGPYVITKTIYLPAAGTYQLNLTPTSASGFLAEAWITVEEDITTSVDLPGGGVRIQKVVSDAGKQTLIKSYDYTYKKYSNSLTISSGILLAPLAYQYMATIAGRSTINSPNSQNETLVSLRFMTGDNRLYKERILMANSSSCLPLGTSGGGSSVGYSQVTETLGTTTAAGGRVVETFINNPERMGNSALEPLFPGVPNIVRNDNGLLQRSIEYAANGTLLKATGSAYTLSSAQPEIAPGVVVYSGLPRGGCTKPSYARYYEYNSEWWRKAADTTITYANSVGNRTSLRTITTYSYDFDNKLVNKQRQITSTGDTLTTRTTYAHNVPTETQTAAATWRMLTARHMIGLPIKQETYRGTRRVQASVTNYSSQLLPVSQQQLDGDQLPIQLVYDSYDKSGNLTQYHPVHGGNTAILWGYQQANPVVTARNASYTALNTAVTDALTRMGYSNLTDLDTFLTSLGELTTNQEQRRLSAFVQAIQQHTALRQAQVTVYTHQPLAGKLSETDPAGRTIFYEYDALSRLVCTRDEQGRILSRQQYHYAGK